MAGGGPSHRNLLMASTPSPSAMASAFIPVGWLLACMHICAAQGDSGKPHIFTILQDVSAAAAQLVVLPTRSSSIRLRILASLSMLRVCHHRTWASRTLASTLTQMWLARPPLLTRRTLLRWHARESGSPTTVSTAAPPLSSATAPIPTSHHMSGATCLCRCALALQPHTSHISLRQAADSSRRAAVKGGHR